VTGSVAASTTRLSFAPRGRDPRGGDGVPLSVLDLAPVATGSSVGEALEASIALATRAEALGYTRFWVAEHHNMPGIASSSPPVLLAAIAARTSTIRVGSGGVMLPNHAPLVVAEQFGMLEALHPGRVDLGIGRAPGTDQLTAFALRRSVDALSAEEFPTQLTDLIGFFSGQWPAGHLMAAVTAVPGKGNAPDLWLLGSSGYSAQVAGTLGLPLAFAHHFSPANTLPALELYRSTFRPSDALAEPYAMVCAAAVCAASDEAARDLARPSALGFLKLRSGRPSTTPTPAETASYPYSPAEREFVEDRLDSQIIGSPATVRRGIDDLLIATQADELMLTTSTFDPVDRSRSFELVAELSSSAFSP
jgi:luciferase family oxidoreductase group 1